MEDRVGHEVGEHRQGRVEQRRGAKAAKAQRRMFQAYLFFHDRAQALQVLSLLGSRVGLATLIEHGERQGCQARVQSVLRGACLEP
ncbi:hypothetical protein D3C80_1313610 [compost metagenome]